MPGLVPGIVFINLNRNTNMSEKRTHTVTIDEMTTVEMPIEEQAM